MFCFICRCLKKGLLGKRLMIAMRTEVKGVIENTTGSVQKSRHSVHSPKNFWGRSRFSKGFCLWGRSLSKWLGRKGLGRNLNFQISVWWGSLTFDNLQRL